MEFRSKKNVTDILCVYLDVDKSTCAEPIDSIACFDSLQYNNKCTIWSDWKPL